MTWNYTDYFTRINGTLLKQIHLNRPPGKSPVFAAFGMRGPVLPKRSNGLDYWVLSDIGH
jgi:hypothetical protein